MSELLSARNCLSCGGQIPEGVYTCPYCGTTYERPRTTDVLTIQRIDTPVRRLTAQVYVDDDELRYVGHEKLARRTIWELSQSLAEAVAGYMSIQVTEDPDRLGKIYRAELQVVEPDCRI